ncbi:MAG: glutamate racemase [Chitinophagaceae bacterium]
MRLGCTFIVALPHYRIAKLMIGVFDSGYGGLTVLRKLVQTLPAYDYIYLGDNARAPYGTRSFETVYRYTLEAVEWLFQQGCPLVVLACNTASAKALRTIQQNDLPKLAPDRRVLGVIRPTTEVIGKFSISGQVGIMATPGTVASGSYPIEIEKFYPGLAVYQQACPMLVPLIENNDYQNPGGDYFIRKYVDQLLTQSAGIDTILLACTHYPLISNQIAKAAGERIRVIGQDDIVAESLADYLKRHPEMEQRLSKSSKRAFYTTDSTDDFDKHAESFFGQPITSKLAVFRH